MTFDHERARAVREDERIDRLVEWLEMTLGARLTAYAVAVSPVDICQIAHGDNAPSPDVERRLRDLYRAAWFIAATDGPGTAHDWLTEPNPGLENRAPADLLHSGHCPAPAWFSTAPAF